MRSLTNASCAAKPLANRPIWSLTCASTRDTNHSLAAYATRPFNVKSIYADTATVSIRPWPICLSHLLSHSIRLIQRAAPARKCQHFSFLKNLFFFSFILSPQVDTHTHDTGAFYCVTPNLLFIFISFLFLVSFTIIIIIIYASMNFSSPFFFIFL